MKHLRIKFPGEGHDSILRYQVGIGLKSIADFQVFEVALLHENECAAGIHELLLVNEQRVNAAR
jgi:hypothetical protein